MQSDGLKFYVKDDSSALSNHSRDPVGSLSDLRNTIFQASIYSYVYCYIVSSQFLHVNSIVRRPFQAVKVCINQSSAGISL
jgi:hypothetical protein